MSENIDQTLCPKLHERLAHGDLADTKFRRDYVLQQRRSRRVHTRQNLLPDASCDLPAHGSNQILRHRPLCHITWNPEGKGSDGSIHSVLKPVVKADPSIMGIIALVPPRSTVC